MFRNLLRSFECTLRLHAATNNTLKNSLCFSRPAISSRCTLFTQIESNAAKPKTSVPTGTETSNSSSLLFGEASDADHEYVSTTPYNVENEASTKAKTLINALRERFRLTEREAQCILNDDLVQRNYRGRSLTQILNTLQLAGVSKRSFIEYPWLLILDHKRLVLNLNLIKSMHIRDINHFVPFLRLTVPRLRKLVGALNMERGSIPQQNRVYYISEKLQVSPEIVTKYLSKRLFILEMPFEMFEKNLKHMIDYNVSPINLLKDLWAFRYTPKSVQIRLERAKRAKKDKIMPWMVRCPEPILERSLKLTQDELKVLGQFSSVVEYLAHRLGYGVDEAKAIMDKHPQVHTVRVTKIKEILDYLLEEEDFSPFEIAQVPRIFCHGLKTTRARIEELKTINCRPSSLVILCRSKREYEKFLQYWRDLQKYKLKPNDELNRL